MSLGVVTAAAAGGQHQSINVPLLAVSVTVRLTKLMPLFADSMVKSDDVHGFTFTSSRSHAVRQTVHRVVCDRI